MWKTKNSRFQAADRLRARSWWKGISISILSAYVLALSVLPKFITGSDQNVHRDYIGLVALVAAVIILVFSVVSVFDDDDVRSRYMHDNARDISGLYHEYKMAVLSAIKQGGDVPDSAPINERYQHMLSKCPYNHDPIDYRKTLVDIDEEQGKETRWWRLALWAWTFYDVYFWPVSALTVPVALGICLFARL